MIDDTIHQNHQDESTKITHDKEIVPENFQDETQDEIFAQNETDCLDKPSTTEDLSEMESINKRSLRSMTQSGNSTKKDYRTLAGFNPRKHIRQSDANFAAQDVFYTHQSGDYYVNSPQFYQFAYSIMHKNGDEDLPNTIEEARNSYDSENWEKAIQTELDILRDKNTWELIEPPKDRNIVGNRWVFTKKFDENGNLSKYKARLVAQGFSQGFIYDYSDTFSPVVRFDSFRLLVSIAAFHNHPIGQMDIKGAYLNGNLEEEIYMRQPKGCDDGTGRVCRLKHTLYGLKQSGREWNKTLRKFLVEKLGYKQLVKEHGIFFRKDTEGYDIIAVWVDDFFIVSTSSRRLQKVKQEISIKWETTDQGNPKLLLGINLERNYATGSIKISQRQYIMKILRRFNMENSTPSPTPLPSSLTFMPNDNDSFEDPTKYRAAIGSLMFAAIASRPDIAYATNLMAQFSKCPGQKHWNGVKHIFRYLKGSIDTGIIYDRNRHSEPKFTIITYSDADNGKGYDRKSISGSVIVLSGGAIKWTAEKQRLITVSTTESEYVAANLAGRNTLFIRDIMEEMGFIHDEPIPIFMDSDGAISLTKNPENMRATIHIDKIYHWIRQHVEEGTFSPESIPSKENPADLFTKLLPKSLFDYHTSNIGILNAVRFEGE